MPLRDYQEDLVNRVKKSYLQGHTAPCIVLPCGGGKSCIVAEIAKRTTYKGNNVLFLIHRKELKEQIEDTFSRWGVDMSRCDIMMVQTACRRTNKISSPSLIITDENHHCLASSYKKIYSSFPQSKRLGVTATPVRLNGDGLGDVNDELIIGVTAKWLIKNRFLSPYTYYAPSVADLTHLKVSRGEYVTADIEKLLAKNTVFGDVIEHYKKLAYGKQAICYCASVKHSESMAEAFRDAGISAEHIDATSSPGERARIIEDFRNGKIKILCNVDLISEGFDVPDCECSILLRPTKSLTLFIQQSMRCMRYKDGKTAIIIDHVGNYLTHGLPDDERSWTLAKKDRKIRENKAETEVNAKMCPKCFAVFSPKTVCPYCGYEIPKQVRNIKEESKTELRKIDGIKLDFNSPAQCRSMSDLILYAKKKGYKAGWAYYQAKKRGYI